MSTKHASFATASSSAAPSTSAGNVQAVYDNLKEHILPELRINAQFFEEALQAILHTVLFVRATPDIRPKDVCCDKLAPVIYATCGIAALDGNVNNTIDLLKRSLIISSSGQNLRGEITLSFYQRREKSAGWLFTTNQTEHVYFERWRLPVTVLDFQNTSFAPSTGSGKMGSNLSASTMLSGANYGSAASNASQRRHSTGGHSATPGIGYFQQGAGGTVSEGVDDSGNASSSGDAMRMAYRSAYDQVTKAIMSIIETATSTSTQVPDVPYFFHLNVSDVTELRTSPAFNRGSGSGPGSAASSGKTGGHSGLHAALGAGRSSPMVPSGPGITRR